MQVFNISWSENFPIIHRKAEKPLLGSVFLIKMKNFGYVLNEWSLSVTFTFMNVQPILSQDSLFLPRGKIEKLQIFSRVIKRDIDLKWSKLTNLRFKLWFHVHFKSSYIFVLNFLAMYKNGLIRKLRWNSETYYQISEKRKCN